jgi:hypothetical protein
LGDGRVSTPIIDDDQLEAQIHPLKDGYQTAHQRNGVGFLVVGRDDDAQ